MPSDRIPAEASKDAARTLDRAYDRHEMTLEQVAEDAIRAALPHLRAHWEQEHGAEVDRLRAIMDRPDPHEFLVATEIEARYQLDRWGDEAGQPTAFGGTADSDFYRLIQHLASKAMLTTPDEGLEKRLHRITTVAAAACNWHRRESAAAAALQRKDGQDA
jgi:hypothetical protein